jgi:hypothetical protein
MDSSFANGIGRGLKTLVAILLVSLPLAIWKLVDIGIWIFRHLEINWR